MVKENDGGVCARNEGEGKDCGDEREDRQTQERRTVPRVVGETGEQVREDDEIHWRNSGDRHDEHQLVCHD